VPEDHAVDPQVLEHRRRDLAGVGALLSLVHVLGGDPDPALKAELDRRLQRGEGRTHDDLRPAGFRDQRQELAEEALGLLGRLVHLPVGGEVGVALRHR
jgi:hypothetical protein